MKVRCNLLLPGQILPARLVEAPSMVSRNATRTVLEIDAGAPVQLEPPTALGTEVVDAGISAGDSCRSNAIGAHTWLARLASAVGVGPRPIAPLV